MTGRFHSAMTNGQGKQILQQTLTDLTDYTKHHFCVGRRSDAEKLLSRIPPAQGGISSVPEPSSFGLLALTLPASGLLWKRRRALRR
jgi:hypothetical protein